MSAFEVYQKAKQAKKKSSKKKNKVKEVKVNPQIVAELQKVAEVNEIKKKKAKVNEGAQEQSSYEASGECATNIAGMLLSVQRKLFSEYLRYACVSQCNKFPSCTSWQ